MVFSFFGKKDSPPKPAAKPAARPAAKPSAERAAAPRPEPRPAAAPAAPSPAPAAAPPAASPASGLDPTPARSDLPSLDFTASVAFNATESEIASNIEIHESSDQVHPLVEEAAILYANGNDRGCLAALEGACLRSDLGASAEQVWLMLFDLYHVLERRDAFDAKALEYVVRFERSPPAWRGGEAADAAEGGGATPMAALGPVLDAAAAKQLDTVSRLLAKNPSVRLDAGKVKEADGEGCSQLLACLRAARRERREVIVQNAANLVRVIEARLAVGTRQHEDAWLLLLELIQQQGLADQYEEWALNYAITFEVSPPAWEPPKAKPKVPPARAPAVAPPGGEAFALSGEMSGACAAVMQQLRSFGDARESLVVDLAQLKRIDFVCAGNLLNTLFQVAASGKPIRLINVSAIVAALLKVVGVAETATVERRKY